jgi:hypothetical protein
MAETISGGSSEQAWMAKLSTCTNTVLGLYRGSRKSPTSHGLEPALVSKQTEVGESREKVFCCTTGARLR